MAFKQVLPGIFEMFLPLPMKPTIINAWLIDCGGGEWAMVDTGMNLPESFLVMEDAFRPFRGSQGPHRHPSSYRPLRRVDRDSRPQSCQNLPA
jgi:hypothetical protein